MLKKVKTNTNLIKNINLNNEQNIKDQYIGELIDITINRQIETNFTLSEEDAINFLKKKFEEIKIKK